MTKFLDTIKAFQHNDRASLTKLKPPKMLDLNEHTDVDVRHTYRIEARFAIQIKLTPDSLEQAVEHTRREIAEYVYGDINNELIGWFSDLRYSHNIHQKDCEEFYKILDKMQ